MAAKNSGLLARRKRTNSREEVICEEKESTMSELVRFFKTLTASPAPMDDNALRRRIRELESENRELREKLAFRGPWMF
jgi:hypothetical protein